MRHFAVLIAFYFNGLGIEMNINPIRGQRFGKDLCGIAFFLAEKQWFILDDGDLRTETAKCLRQFASQWPASNHQQASRTFGQIEDALIGEVSRGGKPRNVRDKRTRSGGNTCGPE